MVHTSVSLALVVLRAVPAIGEIVINISVPLLHHKPPAGYRIVVILVNNNDQLLHKTLLNPIAAIRLRTAPKPVQNIQILALPWPKLSKRCFGWRVLGK